MGNDVICYLEDPDTCILILINQLETFGLCSGYKLNLTKTQILTFNYHHPQTHTIKIQFELECN